MTRVRPLQMHAPLVEQRLTRGTASQAMTCSSTYEPKGDVPLPNKSVSGGRATGIITKKIQTVRSKTGYDEKVLHAPADLAVVLVSLMTVANLGILAILLVLAAALVGAVIFT
ncbi:MAG: hypothetical protein KGL39_29865 [Patescibacteria group bacterium]|nr:hypothetical protein [Patescibacteria group bacterium]